MKKNDLITLRILISSLIVVILTIPSIAQNNITFNSGNFTFWEVSIGYKDYTQEFWPIKYNGTDPQLLQTSYPEYDGSPNGIVLSDLNFPIKDDNFTRVFDNFRTTLDLTVFKKYVTIGSPHITNKALTRKLVYNFIPTASNYSVTYAYSIALEDGKHQTFEQPKFTTKVLIDGVSDPCLFYSYQLPTSGAGVIDSNAAKLEGFLRSKIPTKSPNVLKADQLRVWVRDWRIVYLDLSKHIGKNIQLEFEVDNCLQTGHYAYAYLSIKDDFTAPGIMTVEKNFCPGNKLSFIAPNLKNAAFEWTVTDPANFTFLSNKTSYKADLQINPKPNPANLSNQIVNVIIKDTSALSCYTPKNISFPIDILPYAIAGTLNAPTINICQDSSAILKLTGYEGTQYFIQKSYDQTKWSDVNTTGIPLSAGTTTSIKTYPIIDSNAFYRLRILNNPICSADYTNIVTIKMDSASVSGNIQSSSNFFCDGQDQSVLLKLNGYNKNIDSWEYNNGTTWTTINRNTDYLDIVKDVPITPSSLNTSIVYRANISNGVCKNTTPPVTIQYISVPYPKTTVTPPVSICFNSSTILQPQNTNGAGAQYNWITTKNLIPPTNTIDVTTANLNASQDFILSIINSGCPNERLDTFSVLVNSQMNINLYDDKGVALNDPSIQDLVIGQPYVYNANAYNIDKSPSSFNYDWSIIDPIGFYSSTQFIVNDNKATFKPDRLQDFTKLNIVKIKLTSTNKSTGCPVDRFITARIFNGPPQFYVPTGFTPNGDGLNDTFKPFIPGVLLKSFRIFNRFGKVIFETSDSDAAWDGTYNGVPQNSGTYVWQATGIGRDGSTIKSQKGTVTLIR